MRALALAILLLLANGARADDAGGYIGISVGVTSEPTQCESDLMTAPRCEGNALDLRGFVGYAFTRQLAIEAGLSAFDGSAALDLSGIGSMPLSERAALFGRLGAFVVEGHTTLTYGAGLQFDVGETSALRVEWQHFEGRSSTSDFALERHSGNVDVLFLGIMGRF